MRFFLVSRENKGREKMSTLLLTTKLYIPLARPKLVSRPRLIERLTKGLTGKLTLISAPAGFGKTTLLSEWVLPREQGVSWVSLDEGDNDPTRFWVYFINAIQKLDNKLGQNALLLLQSPQVPPLEFILTGLLNELAAFPDHFTLVLDDYHVIDNPAIHEAITFLLDHLPSQMHLMMTTRVDPPLPLSRLRGRGQLTELRAADLRFTPDEATAFLNDIMGLSLAAADIAALEDRTEGWIAGLQLAALSMQGRDDLNHFIAAFTGSHTFIVDYLVEEVIQRQPEDVRLFLLQTSLLNRLCGSLCDAVTGRNDSQRVLEALQHSNLFIMPLDEERHWYRYHYLFAEVLRVRSQQTYLFSRTSSTEGIKGRVAELHSRASTWFESHNLLAEAIDHALAAEDFERAARLVEQNGRLVALRGQVHTVLGWLSALPPALVRARPSLCIYQAAMLTFTNHLEAAEACLQDAERCVQTQSGVPADPLWTILSQVATIRANIARASGDLARAVTLARQALDLLPETEVIEQAVAMAHVAYTYLVSGEVTPAVERLVRELVAPARASGNLVALLRSIILLARLQALQGQLHRAAATYQEVAQVTPGPDGLQTLIGSAAYYFGLSELLRQWNDLDAAERYLAQGMNLVMGRLMVDADIVTQGYITLARLKQARGDSAGAIATLTEFAQLAHRHNFFAPLARRGAAAQAQLALAQGNLAAAIRWAKSSGLGTGDELDYLREMEHLTLARVIIAQGGEQAKELSLPKALHLLDRLLLAAQAGGRIGSVIEILNLRALALQAQNDPGEALAALEQSLSLAEPEGCTRIYVDEGAPMAALLQAAQASGLAPGYVSKLLIAFNNPPLTLHNLPTESLNSSQIGAKTPWR
jgi:LuxR family transcriptional regulator, maltose regulon positive regulatory protein